MTAKALATALVVAGVVTAPAFAAPSAKFAANVSAVALIEQTTGTDGWQPVLRTTIKTPNQKDLLLGASFETGLYTQTKVAGKNGELSTSTATATLKMRVLVDGQVVNPGEVTYDHRMQQLSAKLGGVIESCQDVSGDGIIDVGTECVVTDEEIELILDTMAAHHFNFVAANLSPGAHAVEVQAMIDTGASATSGNDNASAKALVGKGSLTVEEVRATNSPDGITFLE